MDYCLICAEDFDDTNRKSVKCPYCHFDACMTCCKTYILDRESNVCMNMVKNAEGVFVCQKEWTRKFMVETFPKKWLEKQWRAINEKIKFEREKALLPATMPVLERKREEIAVARDLARVDREIEKLYAKKREIRERLAPIDRATNTER